MNVIAYGGGLNSTAMIIGMYHRNIPIDLILFADPGGEQPYTYEYLPIMNDSPHCGRAHHLRHRAAKRIRASSARRGAAMGGTAAVLDGRCPPGHGEIG